MGFRSAMKSVARTDDVELSPGRERRRIFLVSVAVLVAATAAVAAISEVIDEACAREKPPRTGSVPQSSSELESVNQ